MGPQWKDGLRRMRRRVQSALGRDLYVPIEVRCPVAVLGSDYGRWGVCAERLDSRSVVYRFGVGADVSFDLALIQRWDLHVHAFDPTPRSIAWVRRQKLPEPFHFHELGLADYDGVAVPGGDGLVA